MGITVRGDLGRDYKSGTPGSRIPFANTIILCKFVPTVHATLPIRTASRGVSFAFMKFNKIATTIAEQIKQLADRGLVINDYALTEHFLKNISYYRLSGYWWPMQADKVNHVFKPNSRFDDVIALYNFDRELRLQNIDKVRCYLSSLLCLKPIGVLSFFGLIRYSNTLKILSNCLSYPDFILFNSSIISL
jgi:hypothetical protein